jgi:RNA polymerase sigma-70 factor (ECF subfamily)
MEETFVKLLMEHRSMLHGFIYAIVRNPHLAEDAMQEVASVLWTKFRRFEQGTNFGAWARAVAYREVISLLRKEKKAARHLTEPAARQLMEAYERRQERVDVTGHREAPRSCASEPKDDLRKVLSWRYEERMTSAQIGERLKRSTQAVNSLIYRTKNALADCVQKRLSVAGGEA